MIEERKESIVAGLGSFRDLGGSKLTSFEEEDMFCDLEFNDLEERDSGREMSDSRVVIENDYIGIGDLGRMSRFSQMTEFS